MVSTMIAPRTNNPRPSLPVNFGNTLFADSSSKLPPVKFQEIEREGQTIVVGRLKVATPNDPGHAFILRRYDTGAVSLTTMFKAAFPSAPEDHEKAESQWVRANFDVTGANGSTGVDGTPKLRLNGTWVSAPVAQFIAPAYGLSRILAPLIEAQPDPSQTYRKSSKPSPNGTATAPLSTSAAATPSNPKRRKGSPAASAMNHSESNAAPVRSSPRKTVKQGTARSTTPRPRETRTPGGSDATAVDADADEEVEVSGPDMAQDVQEQRALIADLKARRTTTGDPTTPRNPRKRQELETPPLSFNFDKQPEVGEREIITRRRVTLQANQKAAAWGTLAFAIGLGASTLLPSLFF